MQIEESVQNHVPVWGVPVNVYEGGGMFFFQSLPPWIPPLKCWSSGRSAGGIKVDIAQRDGFYITWWEREVFWHQHQNDCK